MKRVAFLFSLIFSIFAMGCGASVRSSADWSAAYKDGECTKDAGQDAYVACLEKSQEVAKRHPPPVESASGNSETRTSQRVEETYKRTETVEPVPKPVQPPPPSATDEKPQQATLPSGTVIWVPVAAGPYCSLPSDQKVLELTINNSSPYLLEVRGKVVPLNCQQGDKFIQARVQRRNGKQEATWVIPGNMQGAKLVFLPFNGGLGEVDVHIDAFLNMGTTAPSLAAGFVDHTFREVGTKMYKWDVSTGMIKGYK